MVTSGDPDSPTLDVTQGFLRIHQLQGNSNDGDGGPREPPGGDMVILELWRIGPAFTRGDTNADGRIDLSDAIFLLRYLYLGDTAPSCLDAADVNDDSEVPPVVDPPDVSDAIYLLNWLFLGDSPPPPPTPSRPFYAPNDCGADPTDDSLDCASFPPCP